MLPERNSISGKKKSKLKDLQIAFPWLKELKLGLEQRKEGRKEGRKEVENKVVEHKFKYFNWIKTFIGHKDPETISGTTLITALATYNDYFLTGSADKLIKIWNINTGVLEYTFHGHQSKVLAICVKENTVFSICYKKLIIWHFLTGSVITEFLTDNQILGLNLISSSVFVLSSKSGKISLFDLEDFEPKVCEIDQISAISITFNCQYLVASTQNRLKFWALNDFSLACEYVLKSPVTSIKCSKLDFLSTSGKEFNVWRFTKDHIFKYWEQNCTPFSSTTYSIAGTGCMDWCGGNFLYCSDEKNYTEICCKTYDFLQTVKYDIRVLTMAVNESEYVFATGDTEGNVIIWSVPDLDQLFKFQETGNFSLLHGSEISITHLLWVDSTLISGSCKGTHTLYGFAGNQDLITTPIQQFYSMDYLSGFTRNLTMCDFKLNPYKFQPKISEFYTRQGYRNTPATYAQLYSLFKHQEHLAANPFFYEEDVIYLDSFSENEHSMQSPNSVHSVLEFTSDINCFRCKKEMLDNNKWCVECEKTFHAACFNTFKGQLSEDQCLVCFKASKTSKELKISQRSTIRPFIPSSSQFQVGDSVVFIFQAYEFYLKTFTEVPLLDPEILQFIFPTIMQVVYIEYLWPAQGTFNLVSDTICLKLHLSIIGSLNKTFIYLIESADRFLIPLQEYIEKLRVFQSQPLQLQIYNESEFIIENVLEINPIEAEFDHSPWKSIVLLNNQRASFWDTGDFKLETLTHIRRTNLSRFTHHVNLLTKPIIKNFKQVVAYPVSLKTIEERISDNFYRTKNAAIHDLNIMKENIENFFGAHSQENKEMVRIFESLKKEICESTVEPADMKDFEIFPEFKVYLPENYEKVQIVQERFQNKFRKLRKID